jgi:hypothetical protein
MGNGGVGGEGPPPREQQQKQEEQQQEQRQQQREQGAGVPANEADEASALLQPVGDAPRLALQLSHWQQHDTYGLSACILCFAPRPRAASKPTGRALGATVPPEQLVLASPLSVSRRRGRSNSEGQLPTLSPRSASSSLAEELRETKSEVEHLRAQLVRLRSRPSTRSLHIATAEPALLKDKDFEIANLKKDLVLSQLRAESAIKTAVNSINARRVIPSTRNLLASENDERAPPGRSRLNTVATLDQQLLDNNLSLDEYALALATLTQGEVVDDVAVAMVVTGLHEAAEGGAGSTSAPTPAS